jgi:hypothetical protein
MAPTNRLIEARRAELRAEANTQKPRDAKTAGTAAARTGAKRPAGQSPTGQPKARAKSKA